MKNCLRMRRKSLEIEGGAFFPHAFFTGLTKDENLLDKTSLYFYLPSERKVYKLVFWLAVLFI